MVNNLICRSILIISLLSSTTVLAQKSSVDSLEYPPPRQIELSGPRVGFTFIFGALADTLKNKYDAAPFVTQFGWQFEQRFMAMENGLSGLTETVVLVGGIEQGLFLPSLSFLVGLPILYDPWPFWNLVLDPKLEPIVPLLAHLLLAPKM